MANCTCRATWAVFGLLLGLLLSPTALLLSPTSFSGPGFVGHKQQSVLFGRTMDTLPRHPARLGSSSMDYQMIVPDVSGLPGDVLPEVARQVLKGGNHTRNIISMSLFGNNPKYVQGAIENAMLAARDWPGWTLRFYYGADVPDDVIQVLRAFGSELVKVSSNYQSPKGCMYWRSLVIEDRTVSRFIIRDSDARLTRRDYAAVHEWMASRWLFHTMRDHKSHRELIMGGMWGAVGGLLHPRLLDSWKHGHAHGKEVWKEDQAWLGAVVWPLVRNYTLEHASFNCHQNGAAERRGFPLKRQGSRDFIGNRYQPSDDWLGMLMDPIECPAQCRRAPEWTSC